MSLRIVPDAVNHNTSPARETRPARLRPITTLPPGERVKVELRGRASQRMNAYVGAVRAVDGVAVRLVLTYSRFDWSWGQASGEIVLPWHQIECIDVQGEQ